jgi:hypothetical protein
VPYVAVESPIVPHYALLGMLTSKHIHLKGKVSLPITLSPLSRRHSCLFRCVAFSLRSHIERCIVIVEEAVLSLHVLDTLLVEIGQFLRCFDVAHVLEEALGKNEIDFFQAALGCLGVVDVDEWQEAGVDNRKEKIGAPS